MGRRGHGSGHSARGVRKIWKLPNLFGNGSLLGVILNGKPIIFGAGHHFKTIFRRIFSGIMMIWSDFVPYLAPRKWRMMLGDVKTV